VAQFTVFLYLVLNFNIVKAEKKFTLISFPKNIGEFQPTRLQDISAYMAENAPNGIVLPYFSVLPGLS
jgi:hypothetical protein